MGKNRPIIASSDERVETPVGFYGLVWYLIKYAVLSAGLSFIAYLLWDQEVRQIFHSPTISFLAVWSIFILLSIVVVALRGLAHIGISPRSRL